MLEPDDPQATATSAVGLLSDRVRAFRKQVIGGARATGPIHVVALDARASLETAGPAWGNLSDKWSQQGVMGMEAAEWR